MRRKWTFKNEAKIGRPPLDDDTRDLDNPSWRSRTAVGAIAKIEGELLKLGIDVGRTTIRNVLKAEGIEPASVRAGSVGWKQLMSHYKAQLLACDFFTVETIWLKTLTVLFFIDIGTRKVYLAGVTEHPTGEWITQQARNQVWQLPRGRQGDLWFDS